MSEKPKKDQTQDSGNEDPKKTEKPRKKRALGVIDRRTRSQKLDYSSVRPTEESSLQLPLPLQPMDSEQEQSEYEGLMASLADLRTMAMDYLTVLNAKHRDQKIFDQKKNMIQKFTEAQFIDKNVEKFFQLTRDESSLTLYKKRELCEAFQPALRNLDDLYVTLQQIDKTEADHYKLLYPELRIAIETKFKSSPENIEFQRDLITDQAKFLMNQAVLRDEKQHYRGRLHAIMQILNNLELSTQDFTIERWQQILHLYIEFFISIDVIKKEVDDAPKFWEKHTQQLIHFETNEVKREFLKDPQIGRLFDPMNKLIKEIRTQARGVYGQQLENKDDIQFKDQQKVKIIRQVLAIQEWLEFLDNTDLPIQNVIERRVEDLSILIGQLAQIGIAHPDFFEASTHSNFSSKNAVNVILPFDKLQKPTKPTEKKKTDGVQAFLDEAVNEFKKMFGWK